MGLEQAKTVDDTHLEVGMTAKETAVIHDLLLHYANDTAVNLKISEGVLAVLKEGMDKINNSFEKSESGEKAIGLRDAKEHIRIPFNNFINHIKEQDEEAAKNLRKYLEDLLNPSTLESFVAYIQDAIKQNQHLYDNHMPTYQVVSEVLDKFRTSLVNEGYLVEKENNEGEESQQSDTTENPDDNESDGEGNIRSLR